MSRIDPEHEERLRLFPEASAVDHMREAARLALERQRAAEAAKIARLRELRLAKEAEPRLNTKENLHRQGRRSVAKRH